MSEFPPTPEQQTILDAVKTTKQNIMIRARAGCGKTTMLEMIDHAEKAQPYLLMCFNKAIATEAEKRMRSATTVRTFNSLGHKIWAAAVDRKLSLNQKKILDTYRDWETDRKSTRLNSSHSAKSRMPSSA